MSKRITDEARIEEYFMDCNPQSATIMKEKIDLILRLRKITDAPTKRGRKPAEKPAPPIAAGGAK